MPARYLQLWMISKPNLHNLFSPRSFLQGPLVLKQGMQMLQTWQAAWLPFFLPPNSAHWSTTVPFLSYLRAALEASLQESKSKGLCLLGSQSLLLIFFLRATAVYFNFMSAFLSLTVDRDCLERSFVLCFYVFWFPPYFSVWNNAGINAGWIICINCTNYSKCDSKWRQSKYNFKNRIFLSLLIVQNNRKIWWIGCWLKWYKYMKG